MNSERCFVCGREFEDGDKVSSVVRQKYTANADTAKPGKEWGKAHDACFERAVDAPAVVMERVKKLAASSKKAIKAA